jgi:hypothetical protein
MEERMINMLRIPASKDIYEYWKLPLLPDYIKKWASITPQSRALIFAETGELYDYLEYDRMNTLYSMKLIELGIKKVKTHAYLCVITMIASVVAINKDKSSADVAA